MTSPSHRAREGRPTSPIELRHLQWQPPGGAPLWATPLHATLARERTGLVGRNGSGKSVLCALIDGRLAPTQGQVLGHAPVLALAQQADGATAADLSGLGPRLAALARIEQGTPLGGDWALADGHWDLPARWQAALQDAGLPAIDPARPAHTLSGGQRQRVALAGAFLARGALLVLDEPSNHLDADARAWLAARIAGWPGGLLLASHDRTLLEGMDRIIELSASGLYTCAGSYSFYSERRAAEDAAAQAVLEHARAERDRSRQVLRSQHDAQQRRAAQGRRFGKDANLSGIYLGRLKEGAQAFDGREQQRRQQALADAQARVADAAARIAPAAGVALALPASRVPEGRLALRLEQVRLPHVGPAAPAIDAALHGPRRVALTGPNGGGKSTLLRVIARQLLPLAGQVTAPLPCARLDQHHHAGLRPEYSVLRALAGSPLAEADLRTRLALLGLGAAHITRPSAHLSGGERLKATLACALWGAAPAALLLLDEPGNHLDLPSLRALEQALSAFDGALIVASHDVASLRALGVDTHWRMDAGALRVPAHLP